MTRAATQAEQFDHNHDLRKHEPRPDDPIAAAVDIALLVRDPSVPFLKGADLIEQYAQTVASVARVEAVQEATDRFLAELDKQQARLAVQP